MRSETEEETANIDITFDKLSVPKGENRNQPGRGEVILELVYHYCDFERGETQGCLSADGKKADKEGLEIQQREMPGWRISGSLRNAEAREQQENWNLGRQNGYYL